MGTTVKMATYLMQLHLCRNKFLCKALKLASVYAHGMLLQKLIQNVITGFYRN